jgi:hypothetical protein
MQKQHCLRMKQHTWKKYNFAWITLGLFIFSLAGHWICAWFTFVSEQQAHNQPIEVADYVWQTTRDTLENWQSEFLQLLWQVGGLAAFLYYGSPQSKEGDDRKEEKIDLILKKLDPEHASSHIKKINKKYSPEGDKE